MASGKPGVYDYSKMHIDVDDDDNIVCPNIYSMWRTMALIIMMVCFVAATPLSLICTLPAYVFADRVSYSVCVCVCMCVCVCVCHLLVQVVCASLVLLGCEILLRNDKLLRPFSIRYLYNAYYYGKYTFTITYACTNITNRWDRLMYTVLYCTIRPVHKLKV